MPTRVLLDANVLVSRTLRDAIFLIQIESPGMFATCWTEDILAETLYHLRRRNPQLDGRVVAAVRDKVSQVMSERIEGYPILEMPGLADRDDRHVHSAAVAGQVGILVTDDRGFLDLDPASMGALSYDIVSADGFLVLADDSGPDAVRRMVRRQWEYWRGRDPASDLPARFVAAGCPAFAERVAGHIREL